MKAPSLTFNQKEKAGSSSFPPFPLHSQISTLVNCWQANLWHSQTVRFPVSLQLTFHLVVFVLRIKHSAYPHTPSRHGSQSIIHSFFRMDVPVPSWIGGVPQKVGQFNYTYTILSPPLRASRLIIIQNVHLHFHCVSFAFQESQGLHRLASLTRYPILPLAWEKEPFTSSQCQTLTFLNFNYTK